MKDNEVDDLLISLEDEIERKCFRLRQKKREEMKKRFFPLACLSFLLLPFLLHYFGFSLLTFCIPVVGFSALFMILLLPVLIIHMEAM